MPEAGRSPLPPYLNRRDAAALLGISPRTLANLHSEQRGPLVVYVGARSPRYPVAALLSWWEARQSARGSGKDGRSEGSGD